MVFARVCVEGVLFVYPIATRNARHGHVLNVGDEKIINSVVLAEHGLFLPVPVVSTTPAIKKGFFSTRCVLFVRCCVHPITCVRAPTHVCAHNTTFMYVMYVQCVHAA